MPPYPTIIAFPAFVPHRTMWTPTTAVAALSRSCPRCLRLTHWPADVSGLWSASISYSRIYTITYNIYILYFYIIYICIIYLNLPNLQYMLNYLNFWPICPILMVFGKTGCFQQKLNGAFGHSPFFLYLTCLLSPQVVNQSPPKQVCRDNSFILKLKVSKPM